MNGETMVRSVIGVSPKRKSISQPHQLKIAISTLQHDIPIDRADGFLRPSSTTGIETNILSIWPTRDTNADNLIKSARAPHMGSSRLNLFTNTSQEIKRACGNCNTSSTVVDNASTTGTVKGIVKQGSWIDWKTFVAHTLRSVLSSHQQRSTPIEPSENFPTDRSSQTTRHALSLNPTRKQQSMDPLASHGEMKRVGL